MTFFRVENGGFCSIENGNIGLSGVNLAANMGEPGQKKGRFLQGRIMELPSGKLTHNYGKSPFSMCKPTISMENHHV